MRRSVFGLVIAPVIAACGGGQPLPGQRVGTPLEVTVGRNVVDVAAGDLDGDGALDLVTADAGDVAISVRRWRAGTWVAAGALALGEGAPQPHLVALGDVDADGDLDVVASAHDAGSVWVWRGDGAGAFAVATGSPFTAITAGQPHNHGLVVGDLDGDGDADIVAADQTARRVGVLLADGTGGFAASREIELGGQTYPPVLGDLDGDGRLDLVAPLVGSQAIAVLLGDGAGGFRHAAGSPMRTGPPRPYGLALGDLDGDGRLDVIASHDDTDEVSVLLGDGGGALRAAPGSPVSVGRRLGTRLAATDVDGDGHVDLVGAGSGAVIVMRGDGRGGLRAFASEPSGGWSALAVDLDGDRRVDLVAPEPAAGRIRIWRGR
jgi:hypothetical protein